jgi:hypothetical protein
MDYGFLSIKACTIFLKEFVRVRVVVCVWFTAIRKRSQVSIEYEHYSGCDSKYLTLFLSVREKRKKKGFIRP